MQSDPRAKVTPLAKNSLRAKKSSCIFDPGTGLNYTKTRLHEDKFAREHKIAREDKTAWENKIARRQFCNKGKFCTSYIFVRE